MAKLIEKTYKVADKEVHTCAHDYFDHVVNYGPDREQRPYDEGEFEYFNDDEIALIKKTVEAKGIVKPGEEYLFMIWRGYRGDEWQGNLEICYPKGIYEILVEHDYFDN